MIEGCIVIGKEEVILCKDCEESGHLPCPNYKYVSQVLLDNECAYCLTERQKTEN